MIKKIDNTGRIAYTKQGDVIYNTSNNQLELFDNGEFKQILTSGSTALNSKQDTLVSGNNIKTINGNSVLGSGNITIAGGVTNVNGQTGAVTTKTINGNVLTGTGDIAISGGGIAQNYSTTEQALMNSNGTPLLWVDGKQIYQKSYNLANYPNHTPINDALGIETLISCQGSFRDNSLVWVVIGGGLLQFSSNPKFTVSTTGVFVLELFTTRSTRVTIQYTKI